ncbi:helix-turn-helix domain-containing protein [Cohnella sp. GbtcB17]|uniref:helix-turn-helix domain-containing protein n=1 Tax=Cohnella sp. GbtcB17 TaxID=2824762 RepID=UPI001C310DF1|nr:helix-turn-helix domain-containing protein [Cohnella sp. GbtcB17]
MYSVMLVDDDYPVLEYLSASIPWKELHLEIHSACKNGAIALERAQAAPPDIVITDIGMPQLDGIALIGELKRLKPDIRCIILSCMGDFSYAQQAVRLHVDDYVLKETMRPEQIAALLRKLSAQLAEEKERSRELARLQSKKEENAILLRQGLLDRMTAEGGLDLSWADDAGEAGIGFEGKVWLPVLVALNRLSELSRRLPDERALQLAVGQATAGLTGELSGTVLLPHGRREAVLLFPFRRSLTELKVESVRPSLRALGERLSRESGITATFLIGTSAAAPAALGRAVQQLLASGGGGGRFYLPDEGIFTLAELPLLGEGDLHDVYPEALQHIRDAFLEEDMAQLESAVGHWLDQARERRCHPELVKEWTLKILYDNQTRFVALQHYQNVFSMEVLHRTLGDIATIQELGDWMLQFFKEKMPLLGLIYKQSRRSEILRARQYVSQNIGSKITLEEVADMLHINSSYFSRLFKRETGYNFIQYVTSAKMERAKELLARSNMSVEEVAARLGYENKSYFAKLFKKHIGGTPGEYRGD